MGKYRDVKDLYSREERARNPIKGARVRLRTEIRKLGIKTKFRTDILRGDLTKGTTILIITDEIFEIPFSEFEGMAVKFVLRNH